MKKLMFSLVSLFVIGAIFVTHTSAYEGEFDLSGSGVACKATSVWHESRYRIIGRCDGLVYPYRTQYEYYTLWAHDVTRDQYVRVDDIDRGYFEGDMANPFDRLMISAEQDSGPRRPSSYDVASGSVAKFTFDKSQTNVQSNTNASTNTNTTNNTGTTTVQSTTKTATTSSNAGSIVGRIITSLLVIILVVVGVVIAGSLLFRRRGSVSA